MNEDDIPQAGAPASAPAQGQPNSPRRILVVEDDHNIRRLNTEVLKDYGYHVDAAEDGAVAWDVLQRKEYDLMITDNDMPRLTGVELLERLHAVRKALPVIMATGTLPNNEFLRFPWLHPAAVLRKPYTVEELLGTVQEVLRATESDDEQSPSDQPSPPSADSFRLL